MTVSRLAALAATLALAVAAAGCGGSDTQSKTEAWAARSRYQKGIEGCFRNQAIPPSRPAARLRPIRQSPTAIWMPSIV